MLKLHKLCFFYGEKKIIDDLTFYFPSKGIVALTGPSGCGKTTLLRLISGLEKPNSGNIENTYLKTAVSFQEPRLIPYLNCEENVKFVLSKENKGLKHVDDLFEQMGLSAQKKNLPHTLSGGMQQRLSLIRALAIDSDLLLLDEPFSAMNEQLKKDVAPLIQTHAERGLAIIVTHSKEEAILLGATTYLCANNPFSSFQKI